MAILTKAANSYTDVVDTWSSQTNAYSTTSDDQYASITLSSRNGTAEIRYGFPSYATSDIPDGSTINSVKVSAEVGLNQSIGSIIQITIENPSGTDVGTPVDTSSTTDVLIECTATTTPTLQNLRDQTVFAHFLYDRANSATSETARIDYVSITVDYTAPVVNSLAQAQATISTTNRVFAQATAKILPTPVYSSVYDTFTRSVTDGLGTSDNAGAWTVIDQPTYFDVDGSQLVVTNSGTAPRASLGKLVAPDFWMVKFKFKFESTSADSYVIVRDGTDASVTSLSAGNGFGGTFQVADGNILGVVMVNTTWGGANGGVAEILNYQAGTWIWLRGWMKHADNGTYQTGYVRIWKDGDPEPATYVTITNESSFVSYPIGHVATAFNAYAGQTTTVDDFQLSQAYFEQTGQAQAQIIGVGKSFAQSQAQISSSSTTPASIYYSEGLGFSVLGTTWTDAAEIASTNMVANKTYLILVGGFIENDSASSQAEVRVGYGTTPTIFTDGTGSIDESILTTSKTPFGFMFTHTQGGTAERYVVQVRNSSASQTTAGDAWIVAIRLTDELTENTDYYTNSVTADYTTTASYASQASVTFTPDGTDPWLILGHATRLSPVTDGTSSVKLRINDSVANALVETTEDGGDIVNDIRPLVMAAVYVPSNASHTVTIDAAHTGTTAGTVFNSSIFALNLSKFSTVAYERTAGDVTPATDPSWTTVATVSPTPSTTGDWLVLGYLTTAFVTVTSTRLLKTRLQINPSGGGLASDPAYGDDAPGMSNWDVNDLQPVLFFNKVSLTSGAARTINLDASVVSPPGTYSVRERSLVAVPLLYGGGGATTTRVFAQAQTQIKQVYSVFSQVQSQIKQTYPRGLAIVRETFSTGGGVPTGAGPYTHTVTYPTGISIDDYLVLTIGFNGGPGTVSLASDGWTLIGSAVGQTNPDTYLYGRKATSTWSGNFTYTTSNSLYTGYVLARYSGVDTTNPLDVTAVGTDGAAALTFTLTGISTVTDNAMVIVGVACNSSTAARLAIDADEPVTEFAEVFESSAIKDTLAADGIKATAGTTDTITGTIAQSLAWSGVVGALRPASGGTVIGPTFAQAQASIAKTSLVYSQTQASIIKTYQAYAQAQSTIKATYVVFAQAQTTIKQAYQVYAQAQTWIEAIYQGYGQSQTSIKTTYRSYAQAQAQIKATYQSYAQAQAELISGATERNSFAQSLALIGVTTDLYSAIDEAILDNTDYIVSDGTTNYVEVKLEDLGTPAWKKDHFLVVTACRFGASGSISPRLYQGINFITNTSISNSSWETVKLALSQSEMNAITDYSDLRIRFYPDSGAKFIVSQAYLQRPPAGAAAYKVSAQANAQIIGIPRQWAQAQADIKQTYYVFAQANAYIKVTDIEAYAQAQATIRATYTQYAQSQARIKKTYQVFAQAGAKISTTRVHAQAATWIEQTYNSWAQANAYIKMPEVEGFAQAQARIKQTYQAWAQGNAWIEVTTNNWAQANAQIKQAYQVWAQAQAKIATTRVHAQGAAWVEQTYLVWSQANAYIKSTEIEVFAQAQAQIKTTYQVWAQSQADIKQTYQAYSQAQANIKTLNSVYAQAQTWIENTYQAYANAQSTIKQTYQVYAQAQAEIVISLVTRYVFAQAQAQIKTTYDAYAQGAALVQGMYLQYAQAEAWIEQTYNLFAQAQSDIKQTYNSFAQTGAWIEATVNQFAQSGALIKTTYQGYAQAQTWIENAYSVFAQAQAQIKQTYYVVSQAQAHVKATYQAYAQAQAAIEQTYNVWAQSGAWIEQTYQAYSQAEAKIIQTYQAYAQAQAKIATTRVHAQAQSTVKATTYTFAQSGAYISGQVVWSAQAQATIAATSAQFAQSQAWIETTINQFAQAQAWIENTYQAYAQAAANIEATYNGFAQTSVWIENTYQGYANAQAFILLSGLNGYAQAQALTLQTYQGYAQANAYVIVRDIEAYAQSMAAIKATYYNWAQAQAYIKVTDNEAYAQAQALIKQTYSQFAQAEAYIKTTDIEAYAQAGALIKTTYVVYAQAEAYIFTTNTVQSQAQAQIYTPQHVHPVADISNDGWRGVVI
jgi:hypothetical protein